jgi:4-amino-4-deoxy-L-arabinose transferase-like glycosyltransferase
MRYFADSPNALPFASGRKRLSPGDLKARIVWWPFGLVLLIWGILYLPRLRDSPGWYGDETLTLLVGRELVRGQTALGPMWMTFWHPYFPYQPGYTWLAGFFAFLTGDDILGARFLNATIALAIAMLICFSVRHRFGVIPSLFGALLFLSYEQSVIHFRWIYPHNAVALGFAICLVALLRPSRRLTNWLAGLGLAIASLAHPLFSHGAVAAFACRIKRPSAWLPLAIPSVLTIATALTWLTWSYWPKIWLLEDLHRLFYHYGAPNPARTNFFANLVHFYSHDFFHLGTVACLLLCCRRGFYVIPICAVVVSGLLLQNRQNLTVFYYQAIILVPIFAMAWAGGLAVLARTLRRYFAKKRLDLAFLGAAFVLPIMWIAIQLMFVLQGRLLPRNQPWVTQSVPEVEHAASWLNDRTTANDLVIANVNIAWLLKAKTADFLHATLWNEYPTESFLSGISRERFRYPVDLETVKYVVVGDIDQVWTFHRLSVDKLVEKIRREKWPVVWSGKYYLILQNPRILARNSDLTR